MYMVLSVANYIVQRCKFQSRPINNLKLQKILYFVQAEFLVTKNQACFYEDIEAWSFGPVVPEVYRKYRIFGSTNIPILKNDNNVKISSRDRKILDEIIDECSKYSTSTLMEITLHQTPWIKSYSKREQNDNVITKESIKKYFTEK